MAVNFCETSDSAEGSRCGKKPAREYARLASTAVDSGVSAVALISLAPCRAPSPNPLPGSPIDSAMFANIQTHPLVTGTLLL